MKEATMRVSGRATTGRGAVVALMMLGLEAVFLAGLVFGLTGCDEATRGDRAIVGPCDTVRADLSRAKDRLAGALEQQAAMAYRSPGSDQERDASEAVVDAGNEVAKLTKQLEECIRK